MADSRRFTASVRVTKGKGHIALPFDPDTAWGKKDKHHVSGRVDGVAARGPLAEIDGASALALPPSWLRDNAFSDGQRVDVELWAEGPQVDSLPDDIAAALAAAPAAQAFFESLATFYRKAYLTWLAGSARRPEVRRERISQFIDLLSTGKKERPK